MTEEELQEYNRRHNVPNECPLSDVEREGKIRDVMRSELHDALETYFENSPFAVGVEQHYKDHEVMNKFRVDVGTVKVSFLKSLGRLFAYAVIGAVSWQTLATFIFKD